MEIIFRTFNYICTISSNQPYLITDLNSILEIASMKASENEAFSSFLRTQDGKTIDKFVHQLNEIISAEMDCTLCGNCCKTLMINISEKEADSVSYHLGQSRNDFDEQYVEKGSSGMMIMNKMPCHFLDDNKCTVYEHRFGSCRDFPAMHLPNFKERLFTTFMHYERCPIIFNVVEQLKTKLNFSCSVEK